MLCDNCKTREANVRYAENINGIKKEMHLCEECSQKLGITNQIHFNMGLDFSSLFGGIFEDLAGFSQPEFMPLLHEMHNVTCKNCGLSFEDIVSNGRLGCAECYNTFESQLDLILKRMQGSNRHIGRIGKIEQNENKSDIDSKDKKKDLNKSVNNEKESKQEKLEKDLKLAIKEERYEDAARIRDEIKKLK